MIITSTQVPFAQIENLRKMFLLENNFQIRYDAYHRRGWAGYYLFSIDNIVVGYASVKGMKNFNDRDDIFEFFVIPDFRSYSEKIFAQLIEISNSRFIESQSNEHLLTSMLQRFSASHSSDVILFGDHETTDFTLPSIRFRKKVEGEKIFEHHMEPVGDYVLESEGEVIGTGGFLTHYNFPFADLYMEIRSDQRMKGYGTFLIQQVKKECSLAGRVPSARCDASNIASKKTLLKAGMKIVGFMLSASINNTSDI